MILTKKSIILIILLLLSLLGYTQNSYPKLVVINGDTLVIQTVEQTRWISKELENGNACKESEIQKDSIINSLNNNQEFLMDIIDYKNGMIASKDSTIKDKDNIINSNIKINDQLVKENKKLKRKTTLLTFGGVFMIIISAIVF